MKQLIKQPCPPLLWYKLRRLKASIKPSAEDPYKDKLFPDLVVLNGPFAGMKYPKLKSVGSSMYPKLLGSYEKELHSTISYILDQPYDTVVDIGCAEGYYAVGLGMHLKQAKVYAFDVNETALELCQEMARLNKVEVETGGFCDNNTFKTVDLGKRSLIFCDCEGYETELFDKETAVSLKDHDFLIETHDFINIGITQQMLEVFSETHECKVIESIDDIIKAYSYEYEELQYFDLTERLLILAEERPRIMRWLFAKTKSK